MDLGLKDKLAFVSGSTAGTVSVDINNVPRGTFAPTGRLIAYGGAGLTDISVDAGISLSAWLFAGTGNTRLTGGGGYNVLVGGSNHSVALQPLSVQGQVGLNVAAGVGALELHLAQ